MTRDILADLAALMPDLRDAAAKMIAVDARFPSGRRGPPAERVLAHHMRKPLFARKQSRSARQWALVHAAMLLAIAEQCDAGDASADATRGVSDALTGGAR